MKQPVKGNGKKKRQRKKAERRAHRPEYGTSKLERDFAVNFLDRFGLRYIYQYRADGIGRYYDFAVTADRSYPYEMTEINGVRTVRQGKQPFKVDFIIEVDGDYYHANPEKVDESKLSPMQRRNRAIDEVKDRWCALNGVPILRLWENDIRNNPSKVIEKLSRYARLSEGKERRRRNMKKPNGPLDTGAGTRQSLRKEIS